MWKREKTVIMVKSGKIEKSSLVAFAFWIITMLYKPTMLGAVMTPVAMILTVLIMVYCQRDNKHIVLNKKVCIVVFCIVYYLYNLFLWVVRRGVVQINYLKALISVSLLCVASIVIFNSDVIRKKYVRIFILALSIWSILYVIRIPLMVVARDAYTMRIFHMIIPRYEYDFSIYFPFTPGLGRVPVGPFVFLRLTGFFRECGIGQLFYIWSLAECDYYFKRSKEIKFFLLLGLFFCFSTAGYINFVIYLTVKVIFNINRCDKKTVLKNILLIIGALIFLVAFNNIPGIRLSDKAAVSYNARFGGYSQIFDLFSHNPLFGTDALVENSSSGLLQYVYQVGIVGLLLYYSMILFAYKQSANRKRFVLANVASIVTLTFFQPIWDAPILFMLWFLPYEK